MYRPFLPLRSLAVLIVAALALAASTTASAATLRPELAADVLPGPSGSEPSELTAFDGRLYFVADDGVHGKQIWHADPDGGASMLADIGSGDAASRPRDVYW